MATYFKSLNTTVSGSVSRGTGSVGTSGFTNVNTSYTVPAGKWAIASMVGASGGTNFFFAGLASSTATIAYLTAGPNISGRGFICPVNNNTGGTVVLFAGETLKGWWYNTSGSSTSANATTSWHVTEFNI